VVERVMWEGEGEREGEWGRTPVLLKHINEERGIEESTVSHTYFLHSHGLFTDLNIVSLPQNAIPMAMSRHLDL
jgi:hypothetical protein